jgi:hypothetical protein
MIHKRPKEPNLSDATFLVGRHSYVQTFPCHRHILRVASPVFDAMLNGPEAKDKTKDKFAHNPVIRLTDQDPQAFEVILKYLYTDKLELNDKTIMTTLHSARKYKLDKLQEECSTFVTQKMSVRNVIKTYKLVSHLVRHHVTCANLNISI